MQATAPRRPRLPAEAFKTPGWTTATYYSSGILSVVGTGYGERIVVQQNGSQISVNDGRSVIAINGAYAWVNAAYVSGVVVDAGAGDDIVSLGGSSTSAGNAVRVPAKVYG